MNISYYIFYSDYTSTVTKEIDLDAVSMFKFHYRIEESWHLEIFWKDGSKEELGNCVYPKELAKILKQAPEKVLEITNNQRLSSFNTLLKELLNLV